MKIPGINISYPFKLFGLIMDTGISYDGEKFWVVVKARKDKKKSSLFILR